MKPNKLEPGDRVRTHSGRVTTIIGHTPDDWNEIYPTTAWAQVPSNEGTELFYDGHEPLTLTKSGEFLTGETHGLSLDLMTTVKFRDAMLALATDPQSNWTDTPEETFLEIAEAVRDYLLLPK